MYHLKTPVTHRHPYRVLLEEAIRLSAPSLSVSIFSSLIKKTFATAHEGVYESLLRLICSEEAGSERQKANLTSHHMDSFDLASGETVTQKEKRGTDGVTALPCLRQAATLTD